MWVARCLNFEGEMLVKMGSPNKKTSLKPRDAPY
jgi:hypothetical protein